MTTAPPLEFRDTRATRYNINEAEKHNEFARIALVGNPNSGKSTLFNLMTGSRAKVMNAPGTTVELQRGYWRRGALTGETPVEVIDLPGTYSLYARTPDEQVTTAYLDSRPDLVVVVLDASALARSLYVLSQVIDTGLPVVAAISMLDVAATRGVEPDLTALAEAAQVPVIAIDPRAGTGIEAFGAALTKQLELSARSATDCHCTNHSANPARLSLTRCSCGGHASPALDPDRSAIFDADDAAARFAWTERVLAAALPAQPALPVRSFSDRLDRILLHPWLGLPVFALVMWGVLQLTTTVATPLVDAVAGFFDGPIASLLAAITPDGSWIQSLLLDGILAGVGTVLSFTPLLVLVFLGITILEDSGYLARAAYVADRALRNIGLDGRAMVPLVIGFGCNVPAISATKTMPDARRRLLTGLLVPLTSCPAMLTIYVLVAAAFFPTHTGTVIFLMYALSAILVVLGGLILRATAFRDLGRTQPLVLALPAYRFPKLKFIAQTCITRVWDFIKGAGGVIAGVLVAVWLLTAIPISGHISQFGQVPISDSLYGRAASGVSPILAPAGLDDWRIASALATGFVAKEATVGALAQTLAPGDAVEAGRSENWLAAQFHQTLEQSSGGHPTAAAAAFLVIVLANTPCLATAATQKRQFGWRWALASVVGQMTLAWLLAVITFQVLRVLL